VFLAHFAVTDEQGRRFRAFEEMARGAAGLAGAEAEPFKVWVKGWRAEQVGGGAARSDSSVGGGEAAPSAPASDPAADRAAGGVFPLRLAAAAEGVALDLLLATAKPPVLQGDRGLSVKGPGAGNASYYYSLTRLPTRGTLTLDGERFAVRGLSWLDREWSTTLLGPGERGWDWLALQLDDGREVTGWRIRRPGSPPDRLDSLTLVERDGTPRPLDADRHRLLAASSWTSPAGARYPTAWRLAGPGLDLAVAALLPDQELPLSIRYWEGAVDARGAVGDGTVGGAAVTGRGYVEMTGYDDAAD
jgi:predicted secreted hydrolase